MSCGRGGSSLALCPFVLVRTPDKNNKNSSHFYNSSNNSSHLYNSSNNSSHFYYSSNNSHFYNSSNTSQFHNSSNNSYSSTAVLLMNLVRIDFIRKSLNEFLVKMFIMNVKYKRETCKSPIFILNAPCSLGLPFMAKILL